VTSGDGARHRSRAGHHTGACTGRWARRIRHGGLALIAALAACEATPGRPEAPPITEPLIELRVAHDDPGPRRSLAEYEGETIYLEPEPVLTDPDFDGISASVRTDRVALVLCVKPEALGRLRSRAGGGSRLALVIDARVRASPLVRDSGGPRIRAEIDMPRAEAERLAERVGARWLGCA
jgi:hypothetical protein